MDGDAARAFSVVGPEPARPGDQPGHRVGPVPGGHRCPEPDERVPAWDPVAVPAPPTADRGLDLHGRLEPVDVRTVEQADLDHAHGPARIASAGSGRTTLLAADWPSWGGGPAAVASRGTQSLPGDVGPPVDWRPCSKARRPTSS